MVAGDTNWRITSNASGFFESVLHTVLRYIVICVSHRCEINYVLISFFIVYSW